MKKMNVAEMQKTNGGYWYVYLFGGGYIGIQIRIAYEHRTNNGKCYTYKNWCSKCRKK